jgi:hypothetical protein
LLLSGEDIENGAVLGGPEVFERQMGGAEETADLFGAVTCGHVGSPGFYRTLTWQGPAP